MRKVCAKCGTEKPLDEFHRQPSGPQGRHSWCKPCANEAQRGTRKRKDTPERRSRNNLWTRYRIRPDEFDAILQKQGGVCAICGKEPVRPVVDHNHDSGAVRGILCHNCNIKLPAVEDRQFRLKAIAYLATEHSRRRT